MKYKKVLRQKQRDEVRKRDPNFLALMLRQGGSHGKSEKTKRRDLKQNLRKVVEE